MGGLSQCSPCSQSANQLANQPTAVNSTLNPPPPPPPPHPSPAPLTSNPLCGSLSSDHVWPQLQYSRGLWAWRQLLTSITHYSLSSKHLVTGAFTWMQYWITTPERFRHPGCDVQVIVNTQVLGMTITTTKKTDVTQLFRVIFGLFFFFSKKKSYLSDTTEHLPTLEKKRSTTNASLDMSQQLQNKL